MSGGRHAREGVGPSVRGGMQPTRGYGRPVPHESYLLPRGRMVGLLEQAGPLVTSRLEQEPGGQVNRPHVCLLARKPDRT